jgi:hypothetical protein
MRTAAALVVIAVGPGAAACGSESAVQRGSENVVETSFADATAADTARVPCAPPGTDVRLRPIVTVHDKAKACGGCLGTCDESWDLGEPTALSDLGLETDLSSPTCSASTCVVTVERSRGSSVLRVASAVPGEVEAQALVRVTGYADRSVGTRVRFAEGCRPDDDAGGDADVDAKTAETGAEASSDAGAWADADAEADADADAGDGS